MLIAILTIAYWRTAPVLSSLLLFGALLVLGTALKRHGKISLLAASPLAELLLIVPLVVWALRAFETAAAIAWTDGSTIAALLLNAAADFGLLWLASGRPLPSSVLPAKGIWARRLLAGLCLLAAALSPAPVLAAAWNIPLWPPGGNNGLLSFLVAVNLGAPFIAYVTPLWLVLVNGWSWFTGRKQPASSVDRPFDTEGRGWNRRDTDLELRV